MNSIEIKTALSESDLTAIINGVVDALMPRLNPKMDDDAKLTRADLCEIFGCHYSTLKRKYFIDPPQSQSASIKTMLYLFLCDTDFISSFPNLKPMYFV